MCSTNSTIKTVDLSRNLVSDSGVSKLADTSHGDMSTFLLLGVDVWSQQPNSGLVDMSLASNQISSTGVVALAKAMKVILVCHFSLKLLVVERVVVVVDCKVTDNSLSIDLSANKLITRTDMCILKSCVNSCNTVVALQIVTSDFALEFALLKVVRGHGSQSVILKRADLVGTVIVCVYVFGRS